jgi:hypothetical protein
MADAKRAQRCAHGEAALHHQALAAANRVEAVGDPVAGLSMWLWCWRQWWNDLELLIKTQKKKDVVDHGRFKPMHMPVCTVE